MRKRAAQEAEFGAAPTAPVHPREPNTLDLHGLPTSLAVCALRRHLPALPRPAVVVTGRGQNHLARAARLFLSAEGLAFREDPCNPGRLTVL